MTQHEYETARFKILHQLRLNTSRVNLKTKAGNEEHQKHTRAADEALWDLEQKRHLQRAAEKAKARAEAKQ